MTHLRERLIKQSVLKRIKQWRVVGLFGPRQCGKSTLLRDLLFERKTSSYASLDRQATRDQAATNAEFFLSRFETEPVVLDEIQKAPVLFDEIKVIVDENRKPGQYLLSGSVEFSQKIGVMESLTGRLGSVYMDSLSWIETLNDPKKEAHLKSLRKYLTQGGMPGVCFFRDAQVREEYWNQWLDTLCAKDLKTFSKGRLSSDLARKMLQAVGKLGMPDIPEISRQIRVDARRVRTHIEALCDLFVLRRVSPHAQGVGKERYLLFDCGVGSFLGAQEKDLARMFFFHQVINHDRFSSVPRKMELSYLETRGGIWADLVCGQRFHILLMTPAPDAHHLKTAKAIQARFPGASVHFWCATEVSRVAVASEVFAHPWVDLLKPDMKLFSS